MDADVRDAGRVVCEDDAQDRQVGQTSGLQIRGEPYREFGFAASLVGERQKFDHNAAGLPLGTSLQQGVEGVAVGVPWEEPVAVDEVEQRHQLSPQGVDGVAVVHYLIVAPIGISSPTG